LGLDAQRHTVETFCQKNNLEIFQTFSEVGSGSSLIGRPTMQAAIKLSKKLKAPIVVAKGDRAFRKESDRLNVKESGVKIINVALGINPDEVLEGIHGIFAERERKLISERTSNALKQKIEREGKENWWGHKTAAQARENGNKSLTANADAFAQKMRVTIQALRGTDKKKKSFNAIAKDLNDTGSKTARGKEWTAQQVINVAERLKID
jgi:DNA invertase Pin-like site-specific DNA recombinase